MAPRIGLEEISDPYAGQERTGGSSALDPAGEPSVVLRFGLICPADESLDALRHARRSLLREEWTLGRESGEPSLEDALFSPFEIVWVVRPEQRASCVKKVADLIARANRALEALALS